MLEKEFQRFFYTYFPSKPHFLLGFSGGADSTALFYLLKQCGIPFSAAYLDHGWRTESALEAKELEKICLASNISFFTKKISKANKNQENEGRLARFAFFQEICAQENIECLLLGHHADDQAETVLKRIFEGASLPRLRGLVPVTVINGLKIGRPLLGIKKKQMIDWLHRQQISYFSDPTNQDCAYLRSRIRQDLLPALSTLFGKEVSSSLCRIGEVAQELDEFLEKWLEPYSKLITIHEGSLVFDFTAHAPKTQFEWRTLLHHFFEKQKIALSYQTMNVVIEHLKNGKRTVFLKVQRNKLKISRGKLYLLPIEGLQQVE